MEYGLAHQCNPGSPVYGDASLPQYALPPLARNLTEAVAHMERCAALKAFPQGILP
jgi:hypothetical protein